MSVESSTRRRVKLYALNAERQWDDRGTGHVAAQFVDRLKAQVPVSSFVSPSNHLPLLGAGGAR